MGGLVEEPIWHTRGVGEKTIRNWLNQRRINKKWSFLAHFFLFLIMFFGHLKKLLLKNEEKLINWAKFYNKMIYILYINCILYILSTPWETLFSLDHGLRGRLNFKSVISYKVQFMERRPFFSFYPLSLFDFPQRISGGTYHTEFIDHF